MGGNLFKLGRMPRAQYLEREGEVRRYLQDKIGDRFRIPRYYHSKADFGDMDIVISLAACAQSSWETLRAEFVQELGIEETKSTGAVFSTVYRGLQVDFFVRAEEEFLPTAAYLSFNDASNLIGKICRRLGLKYGEDGLSWVYRREESDHYRRDLPLSKDTEKIFAFLGLDHEAWLRGFDVLEEIFEWVIKSPYFSVAPYCDPSQRIRERANHRPTIARFLEYLDEQQIDKRCDYAEDKTSYIPMVSSHFPEAKLEEQIAAEDAAAIRAKLLQERFSGKRVMALLPLRGAALGAFIKEFRATHSEEEILAMDAAEIDAEILRVYGVRLKT